MHHGILQEFVLKVASRCNLACDYCYVYNGADQGWRQQPHLMSRDTVAASAHRIGEHVRAHDMDTVTIALHGGEPLLAGPAKLAEMLRLLRGALPGGTTARLTVQTNGVLLDERFLDMFSEHGAGVGVSLDGGAIANDRHRRRHGGGSSYREAARAIRLLRSGRYRDLFNGLLCTIDLANDPVDTYRDLAAFDPPVIDFLLPHSNWSSPPPTPPDAVVPSYADWLLAIFEEWYPGEPGGTRIRLFTEIIHLLLGGSSRAEPLGGGLGYAVIETDGTIEGSDTLKSAAPEASHTGLSVHGTSLDEALQHPAIAGQRLGRAGLSETCLACPVVEVCGGGQLAHRYRADEGFRRPSVYCADLSRLITGIAHRVSDDLQRVRRRRPRVVSDRAACP